MTINKHIIDWSDYKNFSSKEFKCSHTGNCEMKKEFLDSLQALRTEYGKSMIISSGYRDKTHPIEANKPKAGEHTLGLACDIVAYGEDALKIIELALKHGIKRIGVSQGGKKSIRFIHLGMATREDGLMSPWIWSY